MKKFLLSCTALAFAATPAFGQMSDMQHTEVMSIAKPLAPAVEKIEVNQDGSLSGKVYANVAGEATPVDAKVTLASKGVVIEAVQTENGSFSFANVAPGAYTLTGTSPNFAGGQTFDVAPYAGTGCSSCSVSLQSVNAPIYQSQSSPVYNNAPVSACQSCGTAAGGGGVGGGGIGGGRLLGGGFNRQRLIQAGLIGGIIAVAVSDDDDDDDVSADQ